MDIGFIRLEGDKWKGADAPEHFTARWQHRGGFHSLMYDVPHDHKRRCSCPEGERHHYFCDDTGAIRPTDFEAFRAKVLGDDFPPVALEITDWLEAHPNVYVDFG